ncbi:3'(2'),5'-bisphosphate nucleotidase CysQ [Pseudomonas neustonica]|jgi:3'(2'), 5'-bisphosphate nucleotidase|uniref:3'(2'),5'-bisphosphate nucleotidase CysQ n=1 Tax=Pseudomonas neustonica TaxID=2487346 RepID=UPI0030D7BB7F|tara:strand:+ start:2111 stop:2890 length:780 start_codon:yes stop_codon:yes gene_type:complete
MQASEQATLVAAIVEIARQAGDLILDIYHSDFEVRGKEDASPVTAADEQAEALILQGLNTLATPYPIIAEEAYAAGDIPAVDDCFWLVDPLDGTREFVNRNGEFTVNIALIQQGKPLLGVVLAPALNQLYAGSRDNGAFVEDDQGRRAIKARRPAQAGLDVLASRSHGDTAALDELLKGRTVHSLINAGSSLKLCLIAAGQADVYPRQGRTMEWDIAAGDAVLRAAGGHVQVFDGSPLRYGKAGFENPHFVASGAEAFF